MCFACMSAHVSCTCKIMDVGVAVLVASPKTGVTEGCKHPYGCRELNTVLWQSRECS